MKFTSNENQLITEYEKHVSDTNAAGDEFNNAAAYELCTMRDNIDPRALALYWWNELHRKDRGIFSDISEDEIQALIKLFALDYLTCHAAALQKSVPSIKDVTGLIEVHQDKGGEMYA